MEAALKLSVSTLQLLRTRRTQKFSSRQDEARGGKSKHPRSEELNFLKAAPRFPIFCAGRLAAHFDLGSP